jgi:hypothetical protein
MALDTFTCPECGVKLRRTAHLRPGVRVQCPRCQLQFPVPEEGTDELTPPPAARRDNPDEGYGQSPLPRAGIDRPSESDRDDPGSTATRRADDFPVGAPGGFDFDRPERRDEDEDYPDIGRRGDNLTTDYRIDLNQWFAHGKEHWNAVLGPAVGFLILYAIIAYVANGLASAAGIAVLMATDNMLLFSLIHTGLVLVLNVLVLAPLLAGVTLVSLAQLKGERWSFGTYFSGFRHYGSVVTLAFIQQVMLLPGQAALLYPQLTGMGIGAGIPQELFIAYAFWLGWLTLYGLLWVRLFFFALPLILDRGYSPLEAMAGSWKLSEGHFLGLLGMAVLLVLINVGGAMLCGIGLLFTVPFTSLVFAAGYLLAGGTRPPVSLIYDEDHGYRRFDRFDEARWRDRRDEDD